jgi:flagellin-specific chaperone FliS
MQLVTELAQETIQWMDFKLSVTVRYRVPVKATEIFRQLKNTLNFPGGRSFAMKLVAGC